MWLQTKQRQNHLHSKKAHAGPTPTNPINIFERFTLKLEEEFSSLTNNFSAGWISRGKQGFSGGKRDVREKRKGTEEDRSGLGESPGGAQTENLLGRQ